MNTTLLRLPMMIMKSHLSEEIQIAAERQAAFFRVLSNSQRVMILWLIAERAQTASEIALATGSSLATTGHHLRILEFNDLVESRREQNDSYYYLADNKITRDCLVFKSKPKEMLMKINLV